MANRGAIWDPKVHTIRDLAELGSKKLPKMYRDYCNEGTMDLLTLKAIDGIVISNHGGRQLDGVPATLDALRICAPVAAGKFPIAVDGGIRRGTDIFKALALGASHCFVGRIPIWGLAEGCELALKILMYELKVAMALAGTRTVVEISRGHVA